MITIYLCGPTVYNKAHIGNIRPILVFDIFTRSLTFFKEKFLFIHNITDIDDKIINLAIQKNLSEQEIANKYKNHYLKLLNILNIKLPTIMPLVTDNIKPIIEFIKKLIVKKVAYVSENNVFFDVRSISNYGFLSHQKLQNLQLEINQDKKFAADFALWKNTSVGKTFDSPWGQGRPGWHTECVAIIDKYIQGNSLSIHAGGIDLLFPHHENENAQYWALYNKELAKKWVHIGHLKVQNFKMSKSLNNVIDTEDFINQYGEDTLRMLFLMSNPTSPLDLNQKMIEDSQKNIVKLTKVLLQSQLFSQKSFDFEIVHKIATKIKNFDFVSVVKDLQLLIKDFHTNHNNGLEIKQICELLGFKFYNLKICSEDKKLYQKWINLRKQNLFNEADKIRNILQKKLLI